MATTGKVKGVVQNLVTLTVDGPVAQNEICYITTGGDKLMAEVLKVVGNDVFVQVFESTRGLKVSTIPVKSVLWRSSPEIPVSYPEI